MFAFVISMTFAPMVSHAMSHDDAKAVQSGAKTEMAEGHDCHHHGEAKADSQKTAQNDKGTGGHCCDKGMCKCVGGTCHGMSKIFGDGSNALSAVSSSSLVFAFDNQLVDSALPERLKRPPRA